jgi:phosphoadenosine phosphosulfate reductase
MTADLLTAESSVAEDWQEQEQLTPAEVRWLDGRLGEMTTEQVLAWAWGHFGQRAAIGTSFQGAGLAVVHIARTNGFDFPVFTLDTGLLFPETYDLKNRLEDFYGFSIESLEPDLTVEQQNEVHGPDLWSRDPDLCCTLRKVLPLRKKLLELDCWITGLRREQSATRAHIGLIELYEFDRASGKDIVKLNPVANWSRDQIWNHIRDNKIPYNPLYDQGYRSIGCTHCTRKTAAGPDERAGRWTDFKKVECGIHTFMAPQRAVAPECGATGEKGHRRD